MLVSEEELSIQVAEIDSVEVNDMNLAKATENEVLKKLATNTSSSNHEHLRLSDHVSHVLQSDVHTRPNRSCRKVKSALRTA